MPSRRSANLLLIAAACGAVTSSLRAQEAIPTSDVPALRDLLTEPAARQEQRDLAAKRLLSRPGAEARQVLRDALQNIQTPGVALAVARALADNPTPDASLITPLFALVEPNSPKPLIDAAAMALSAYKDDANVLPRLLGLAREGQDEKIRIAAIRAAGTYVDKRVAQTMLNLMDRTAQPPSINDAAERALSYMTGIPAETTELDQWTTWWNQNREKPDPAFRSDVERERSRRYDQARAELDGLQAELARLLAAEYQRTAKDQRTDILLRNLRSPEPTVRAIGARIAADAAQTDVTAPAVREQLRTLIGDASPDVRRQAALALALINDADAVVPLLTQLNQETDSSVRAALASALAPIRDVRSVQPLLKLLSDPNIAAAQAAAVALSDAELGAKLVSGNPQQAEQAAAVIMDALRARTTPLSNPELRRDLVRAMAPLKSRAQAPQLIRLLASPGEAPPVLRALLAAVGELGDPQTADAIVNRMNHPDPGVRLAAVRALGKVTTSFEFQNALAERVNPQREENEEVRNATWQVLAELFKKAPADQLGVWEQRLDQQDDQVHRLLVLRVLRDRAKVAGNESELSSRNQQIGEAARKAGAKTNEANYFNESITAFREALAHAVANRLGPQEELISENLMESLLLGVRFEEAIEFAQAQIRKDQRFQPLLAPKIRNEVERLVRNKDYDKARRLIQLALQMNPKLQPMYADVLKAMDQRIEDLLREQNLNPGASPTLNARAD